MTWHNKIISSLMKWAEATSLGESICRGFHLAYSSKKGTMQLQTMFRSCIITMISSNTVLHFSFPINCMCLEGLDFYFKLCNVSSSCFVWIISTVPGIFSHPDLSFFCSYYFTISILTERRMQQCFWEYRSRKVTILNSIHVIIATLMAQLRALNYINYTMNELYNI